MTGAGTASRPLRVTGLQLDGRDRTHAERVDRAATLVEQLAAAGRDAAGDHLVVLPELWATGFFHFDDYDATAQRLDGPLLGRLGELARAGGVWLLAGSVVERGDRGRLHNTAVLLGPDGSVTHSYRKVHLFGHGSREPELLAPGAEVPGCHAAPWGRLAVMTCYDLRFPEHAVLLARAGADLVVVPAAWPSARIDHWSLLLRARAVEGQSWVVGVNGAGTDAGVELGGRSAVVAPDGTVVAELGGDDDVLDVTLDVAEAAGQRARLPFLADRRHRVAPLEEGH